MEKVKIINGIIQNSSISGIQFERRIIQGNGAANVRTYQRTSMRHITIHNTGNAAQSADARAHAAYFQTVENQDSDYVSAHFFVDPLRIVQILPLNEVAWHAGDGAGEGNMHSIAIEICEVEPYQQAEENAAILAAALCESLGINSLKMHYDWSGKYCPRKILDAGSWGKFVSVVEKYRNATPEQTMPQLDNTPAAWAQEAVSWARKNKLIVGDQQGNLKLHDPLTLERFLAILHNYDKQKE